MTAHTPTRRGVAYLLVLGVLVVCTVAAGGLARQALTHRVANDHDRASRVALAVLPAAEERIVNWLTTTAPDAVRRPDNDPPAIVVLDEGFVVAEYTVQLRIQAWDQHGMPSRDMTLNGPLGWSVPTDMRRQLERLDGPFDGLDRLTPRDVNEQVFPIDATSRTIGALVATHNARPGSINVNTAPLALVEAALRRNGRGGIEQIIAAREHGEQATVPSDQLTDPEDTAPALVTRSTSWSFRVDIDVDGVRHAWWLVYAVSSQRRSPQRVQCLAISE